MNAVRPRTLILLAVLAALALANAGCSTFNATEQCQISQYTSAHPHMWKHKIRWDT